MPEGVKTFLAWKFDEVLPGTFRRNKKDFEHLNYPILAPLPRLKTKTQPIEDCGSSGPFIYFVLDRTEQVCYIGKSKETNIFKRWVRPGLGGPASHYWTHSIPSGGCVFNIANGITSGEGPFSIRYCPLNNLVSKYGSQFGIPNGAPTDFALQAIEAGLVSHLSPIWNK